MAGDEKYWKEIFQQSLKEVEAEAGEKGVGHLLTGVEAANKLQEKLEARKTGNRFSRLQKELTSEEKGLLIDELRRFNLGDPQKAFDYLSLAAELKEYDADWFDKNYIDITHTKLLKYLDAWPDDAGKVLQFLYNFKTLKPEFYEQIPEISQVTWDKICTYLEGFKNQNRWDLFVRDYYKAAFLNSAEISKRLKLEDYWPQILASIRHFRQKGLYGETVAAAQALTPEGAQPVVFEDKDWKVCASDLREDYHSFRRGNGFSFLRSFLSKAKAVKYLEVS